LNLSDKEEEMADTILRSFCSWCKKREKIDGEWVKKKISLEEYQKGSHGICIKCGKAVRRKYKPSRMDIVFRNIRDFFKKLTGNKH
jgi:hypothetical protein